MRKWLVGAVIAILAIGGQGNIPAKAEPGPIGNWLMDTPVTLWDRGMDAMEDSADAAADQIRREQELELGISFVDYQWDENEINVSFWANKKKTLVFHKTCNAIRF